MCADKTVITKTEQWLLPPLSLYIHLPWCVSKCPYCDFNSHVAPRTAASESTYVDALLADLKCDLHYVRNRSINSLFIGGGTPTLFAADTLASLFRKLKNYLQFAADCEFTVEANPESADLSKLKQLREMGVNRISLGIQSLKNPLLARIGRAHDADQALRAFENSRQAGFSNINCDLMFGLPGQSKAQALSDLSDVIHLNPEHISWYQLTIEPNTIFYTRKPQLPDEDVIWQLQQEGIQMLRENGYTRYEVSAYSRSRPCLHNLNYWQFGDYLGIGAGGCGKLTLADEARIVRTRKHRMPKCYMEQSMKQNACVETRVLSESDAVFEFLLNALRLSDGFAAALFARTGLDSIVLEKKLASFIDKRWILSDERHFKPSSYGMRFLNEILECCLPSAESS